MLRHLEEADFPVAAQLLAEGFPGHSEQFWRNSLKILRDHAAVLGTGAPLGWLMLDGEQPVGVALTPSSYREHSPGSKQVIVSFSSWYVRPSHRMRAALMQMTMIADAGPVFIDVTPSPEVCRMLPLLGFRAINRGTVLAATPGHACRPTQGVQVRTWTRGEELPPGSPPLEQLETHRAHRCTPLLLDVGSHRCLVVYRSQRIRRLPVARLVYIGSHQVLHTGLAALARHLLRRGFLFVYWDRRDATPGSRWNVLRSGGIWYARGGDFDDCTDFIGTELSMLDL